MRVLVVIILFIVGAAMGSFCCCQAWRVHYKDLGKKSLGKWSVCLNCKHRLAWYENIPVLSWLIQGGKCRKCGAKIGVMEILSEVLMGAAFGLMGLFIDLESASVFYWVGLILTFIFMIILGFLAIYDGKWGELPVFGLMALGVCGGLIFGLREIELIINGMWGYVEIVNIIGAVIVLFGTYMALYKISHGKWVGDGDAYLGLAIALAVGNAWLALWILFVANLLGCIVMAPRKNRKKKIHFGPFLAIGFVMVILLGDCLSNLL